MATIRVRFAPSPTGYLHIGGARTALFNWLFAKKNNGHFLLRIEDTDADRSRPECSEAIVSGLKWLGLTWDGEVTIQSSRINRHAEVAQELLRQGKAYKCYCTRERLAALHDEQNASGIPPGYDRLCRKLEHDKSLPYTVRLKVPDQLDRIDIVDMVKGLVTIKTLTLDDMVLLRSDGTPTYMLSVVVDDHDADITHVIRGDDHLTNTFRQYLIYQANGWTVPQFGHLPLIYSPSGQKLSKRNGTVGVHEYEGLGYLPEALLMYFFTLGFGSQRLKVDEGVTGLVKIFDLTKISKSPSRFDLDILNKINSQVLKLIHREDITRLSRLINPAPDREHVLIKALPDLITRGKTVVEIREMFTRIYFPASDRNIPELDNKLIEELTTVLKSLDRDSFSDIKLLNGALGNKIKSMLSGTVEERLDALRWIITRSETSPNIYNVIFAMGYDNCMLRVGH